MKATKVFWKDGAIIRIGNTSTGKFTSSTNRPLTGQN